MLAIKDLFLIGTITGLIVVGAWITLRSGLVADGRERGARVVGNLYRMVVSLIGGATVMAIIQQWAGLRLAFLP